MDLDNKENNVNNETTDNQINNNPNDENTVKINNVELPINSEDTTSADKIEESRESVAEETSNIEQKEINQESNTDFQKVSNEITKEETNELQTKQNLNDNESLSHNTNNYQETNNNQNMMYQYNQTMNQQPVYYYNTQQKRNDGTKVLKIAIAVCTILLIGIISFILVLIFTKEGQKTANKVNRTIMMYMVGSDLESESAMATADLKDIKPQNIDLENIEYILMVGGSTKWHNYVEEDEVAIYRLTEEGFIKEEVYKLSNMGKSANLTKLLNYAYKNYPAKKYDLIFWNHGLGTLGLEMDEIYEDFVSIVDLEKALKESPFNEKNKMEAIIFATCLSGNLHIAEIVSKYADYMVASEENMWVSPLLDKFNFVEEIEVDDNGKDIGIKFIKNFEKSTEKFNKAMKQNLDGTFSVIDLSKIAKLSEKVDNYLSTLNLEDDYRTIARVRSKVVTYGGDFKGYDTVDLYTLVNSFGNLASSKSKKELLDALEDAVVYNWSKNNYSHGLSIYFPYYGNRDYLMNHFSLLKKLSSSKYYSFIKDFSDMRSNKASINYDLEETESTANINEFMVKLPSNKIEDFASGTVLVYKLMNDNSYLPIYTKEDIELNEEGILTYKNNTKILKVINNDTGISEYIHLIETEENDNYTQYMTYAKLKDKDGNFVNAIVYIKFDEENPNGVISKITKYNEGLPTMALLQLEEYQSIEFLNSKYNITNSFGEYTEYWYEEGNETSFEVSGNNYIFELNNLESSEDYFVIFKVDDIYNNSYYSKLIKIQ